MITTRAQQPKLGDFVIIVCLIYHSWWTTCIAAADAAWYDLLLLRKLLKYQLVDATIVTRAIKALKDCLWYLTFEIVTLAIFSDIDPEEKRDYLSETRLCATS